MSDKAKVFKNPAVHNAVILGSLCTISYLAVYIARNALSAVTPQLTEQGVFSTERIGTLSSVYFITYAFGQLVNGVLGDKITAKYMLSLGLILAGVSNFLFPLLTPTPFVAILAYASSGFFLSMIYGPMTKVVSENTEPIYATRCTLGYTFASFLGSPVAGVFAMLFSWQGVFNASAGILAFMGIVCFCVFMVLERKGVVTYGKYKRPKGTGGSLKVLIKRQIVKFTAISILTGIVRTTVVFWLPTYFSQHLGFSPKISASIFTVATFITSFSAFVSVFIYERLGHNIDKTLIISFAASAFFFLLVFLIDIPVANIVFIILAVLSAKSAASMLWSRYCPSLYDTGMVSSATGFLDFVSYISASVSSVIFANSVSTIGWSGLILVWFALMLVGLVICLPINKSE